MCPESVEKQRQYRHGGTPELDMRRLGMPMGPVLDFSVNLNPLGPPAVIREKWPELLSGVADYPSMHGKGVAYYYQSALNISPWNFLAGNGSTEMIYLLPRVLEFKHVAIITPSYHDYERASLLAGSTVIRVPLCVHGGRVTLPQDRLMEILTPADALWIGRPNNPTGDLFSKQLILDLADRFPRKWFIVDEAFIQFTDNWKTRSFLTDPPRSNILVLHSLTKFFAIAGLRLGGIMGDQGIVARLKAAKEPWSINGIAERVGGLLADCGHYEDETRAIIREESKRVYNRLQAMEGIIPCSPSANYLLCQWVKTDDLDDLLRHLLSHQVCVRDCRNFPGLETNFFRIGLRTVTENDRLLSLLASCPST
ncbi:MAG: threonine-phosphate decarboxylase CobD [Thermodesulfobacteriota bacterium]